MIIISKHIYCFAWMFNEPFLINLLIYRSVWSVCLSVCLNIISKDKKVYDYDKVNLPFKFIKYIKNQIIIRRFSLNLSNLIKFFNTTANNNNDNSTFI